MGWAASALATISVAVTAQASRLRGEKSAPSNTSSAQVPGPHSFAMGTARAFSFEHAVRQPRRQNPQRAIPCLCSRAPAAKRLQLL